MRFQPSKKDITVAVYSCYFGKHEPFSPTTLSSVADADKFLFTDSDPDVPDGIQKVRLDEEAQPAYRASRVPKLCPHRFFSGYDWTVYIDNSARLLCPVSDLRGVITAEVGGEAPPQRYVFQHWKRDCIFEEVDACRKIGALSNEDATRLLERFNDIGMERHSGLGQHTLLMQRMGDPKTDDLNEKWLELFNQYSRRDQLTLRLAEQVTGTHVFYLKAPIRQFIEWPLFGRKQRFMFQHFGMTDLPKPFSRRDLAYRLRRTALKDWLLGP